MSAGMRIKEDSAYNAEKWKYPKMKQINKNSIIHLRIIMETK